MQLNVKFVENEKRISAEFGEVHGNKIDLDFGEVYGTTASKYEGSYEVVPKVVAQTLPTAQKIMQKDLVIAVIPYAEVSNLFDGKTVTIG